MRLPCLFTLAVLCLANRGGAAVWFRLQPESCLPGSTVVAWFHDSGTPRDPCLRGLGQKARFYRTGPAADDYWALLAVPLGAAGRRPRVSVAWREDGRSRDLELGLRVGASRKGEREIRVPGLARHLLGPLVKESRGLEALYQVREADGRPRWHGLFLLPVQGPVSSPFGVLGIYNGGAARWWHRGVDLAAPRGTLVRAANQGRVKFAGFLKAYGGAVVLDHGDGLRTCYFHLSRILVEKGQVLKKGQPLGKVGSLGIATGPHLHWQMMLNGFAVNPLQWVSGSR